MKVTLLGTGTSTGVPMIGCQCRTCLSEDPRDKRLRVSALIQTASTNVLIDTSADFRQQMLRHDVRRIDGIFYTHFHYDHISGFDDLRAFQFLHRKSPKCYANQETYEYMKRMFAYAFGGAKQSGGGLPEVDFAVVDRNAVHVGDITMQPLHIGHGVLDILGYRAGKFAYLTDCNTIPKESLEQLNGLDVLVLDGLRYSKHPTHLSIDEAVDTANRIGARVTYLTHMNHDVLHAHAEAHLPENVRLGYDNLTFTID
ncbi:MAG TPA: MBL fold metallo-hydrolase [Candidatus Kapabacteria bacterium]|nr:MBL fold metallo-hydrolase [Candidatus Kapabacteria bacterium]